MSRAYRVRVSESIRKVLRADDKVSTQLEILEILPGDEMGELLAQELEKEGFERDGDDMVKTQNDVKITVDIRRGSVTVASELEEEVELEGNREGRAYDDIGPSAKETREKLKEKLKEDLDREADKKTEGLQSQVTDKLEQELGDIRQQLDQAVNRTTAEALKRKAAQMGEIKEMTEDEETGSLTIVVEV